MTGVQTCALPISLRVALTHLNNFWQEGGGRKGMLGRDGLSFQVSSLAEVGSTLLTQLPAQARGEFGDWRVVSLRFPSSTMATMNTVGAELLLA